MTYSSWYTLKLEFNHVEVILTWCKYYSQRIVKLKSYKKKFTLWLLRGFYQSYLFFPLLWVQQTFGSCCFIRDVIIEYWFPHLLPGGASITQSCKQLENSGGTLFVVADAIFTAASQILSFAELFRKVLAHRRGGSVHRVEFWYSMFGDLAQY